MAGIYLGLFLAPLVALTLVPLSFAQFPDSQDSDRFACLGSARNRVESATKQDYRRLGRDLSYAQQSFKDLSGLAGYYEARVPYSGGEILTIEIAWQENRLYSRLVEWDHDKITTEWRPVLTEDLMSRSYLSLAYGEGYGIYVRPIAPGTFRYAYMDTCELNFPNDSSLVFTKKKKPTPPRSTDKSQK